MEKTMKQNKDKVTRLDVRPLLESGQSPLGVILESVQQLGEKESLLVVAPFEPHPLYMMLAEYGYGHESRVLDDGSWEILFSPSE